MALDDKTLNNIFKTQKKGSIDSLRSLGITEARRQVIRLEYEEKPIDTPSYLNDVKKLEPKLSQSEAKLEPEIKPNLSQSEAKLEPSSPFHELNINKLEPKLEPKLSQSRVKLKPNLSQSEAKLEPKLSFTSLIGLQRNIVLFIHEICQTLLEQQTNPLSIETIATQCKSPKSAIRKAIQRLEQKKILLRADFKNGRGGWTRYQLPDQIYQEILRIKNHKLEPNLSQTWVKLEPNLSQSEAKLRTELRTELEPSISSSSSSLILKETTTTELPDAWNFDITSYEKFGFRPSHLKQLAQLEAISAADVEQSLIEFNFDFENNLLPPIRTGKINLLMGLFRQGNVYLSENYKSEQEAMTEIMAERVKKKRQQALEEQLIVWEANLNEEERERIAKQMPPHLMVLNRTNGIDHPDIKKWLMNYFINQR